MELLEVHAAAMEEFGRRVHRVGADQWDNPTPCTEWNVRALVSHIVSEQLWAPHILAGRTIAEAGDRFDGDQLGDRSAAVWDRAAAEARAAFSRQGALEGRVHLSYGDDEATTYARQMTTDLAIHAWDLARGIGADERLDPQLVARVHEWVAPQMDALAGTGLFAPPVAVETGASLQARTLAMLGPDAGGEAA